VEDNHAKLKKIIGEYCLMVLTNTIE